MLAISPQHSTLSPVAILGMGIKAPVGDHRHHKNLAAHQDDCVPSCPSCLMCKETCSHIVQCPEAGRTKAFQQSVAGLETWMANNATHPIIKAVVTAYALGRDKSPPANVQSAIWQ